MAVFNNAISTGNTTLQPQTVNDIFTGKEETIAIIDYGDRDPLSMLLNWRNTDGLDDYNVKKVKYGERLLQFENSKVLVPSEYTKDEFELASKIRHYYQEKIIMKGLRGEKLTGYQNKLSRVLTDRNKLDADAVGVLIKLPEFYEEDCAMDKILKDRVSMDKIKKDSEYNPNERWQLISRSSTTSHTRRRKHKRYFLENNKKQMVMLYANSAQPDGNTAVLDALIENFDCFSISGPISTYPLPGRYFSVGVVTHRNSLKVH